MILLFKKSEICYPNIFSGSYTFLSFINHYYFSLLMAGDMVFFEFLTYK